MNRNKIYIQPDVSSYYLHICGLMHKISYFPKNTYIFKLTTLPGPDQGSDQHQYASISRSHGIETDKETLFNIDLTSLCFN